MVRRGRPWAARAADATHRLLIIGMVLLAGIAARWVARATPWEEAYPLWAALFGWLLARLARRSGRWSRFHELLSRDIFLKLGLVLLGASVDVAQIQRIGGRGLLLVACGVGAVFSFTWWLATRLQLDRRLRSVLVMAVAVSGLSGAAASAAAVRADREQLTLVTTLVIVAAIPMTLIQPLVASWLNISPVAAGAWIGANLDTTASVLAAGSLLGEKALQVASVVKLTQNSFIGLVAALQGTLGHRGSGGLGGLRGAWERLPRFLIGFVGVSAVASSGWLTPSGVASLAHLRNWFLTLAFVCVGFSLVEMPRPRGSRRAAITFVAGTAFSTVLSLLLSLVLFRA